MDYGFASEEEEEAPKPRVGRKFQALVCPHGCVGRPGGCLCGSGLPAPPEAEHSASADLAIQEEEGQLQAEAAASYKRCLSGLGGLLLQRLCGDLQHKVFSGLSEAALGALASVGRLFVRACRRLLEAKKKELIRTHSMLVCAFRPCAGLVGCEVRFLHRDQNRGGVSSRMKGLSQVTTSTPSSSISVQVLISRVLPPQIGVGCQERP